MMTKVLNAGLTLVQHCFSTIHDPNPRVASHRLGTTTLIQLWYNVGKTIPDLEAQKFEDKEIFWRHGNFRETECFNVVKCNIGCTTIQVASHRLGTTTLIQLWYNVGTTIPDLETQNMKTKKFFGDTGILERRNVLML